MTHRKILLTIRTTKSTKNLNVKIILQLHKKDIMSSITIYYVIYYGTMVAGMVAAFSRWIEIPIICTKNIPERSSV